MKLVWVGKYWDSIFKRREKFSIFKTREKFDRHETACPTSPTLRRLHALAPATSQHFNKGSSINYVIVDRGGGVSPKDYGIT